MRTTAVTLAGLCLASWLMLGAERPAGRKYALVVGVSGYDSDLLPRLRYTENDAEKLAEVLRARGFLVRLLTTSRGKKDEKDAPTAKNLRAALDALAEGKKRGDLVLLALSGHG